MLIDILFIQSSVNAYLLKTSPQVLAYYMKASLLGPDQVSPRQWDLSFHHLLEFINPLGLGLSQLLFPRTAPSPVVSWVISWSPTGGGCTPVRTFSCVPLELLLQHTTNYKFKIWQILLVAVNSKSVI